MTAVSTAGRVFVAQLTRDLVAREAAGAGLLSPGAKQWNEAFRSFKHAVIKTKSPTKAAAKFKTGLEQLQLAQKNGACFINCHMGRSRSGYLEVLTWEVAKHPLTNAGYEEIIVRGYCCLLQRRGGIRLGRRRLAFCSWHALARMYERSNQVDIFESRGVVAGCGIVGMLMCMSDKHANTGINYATADNLLCAGVLRVADDEGGAYGFFDVLTAFKPNEEGPQVAQWNQGCAIARAVHDYIESDDPDRNGYADDIEVLPLRGDDFISRELKRAG